MIQKKEKKKEEEEEEEKKKNRKKKEKKKKKKKKKIEDCVQSRADITQYAVANGCDLKRDRLKLITSSCGIFAHDCTQQHSTLKQRSQG